MKKLNQFIKFDFEAFSVNKVYQVIGISAWNDYNTKEHLGTKVDVIIAKDETPYKLKEGEVVSNAFEKLSFKVAKDGVMFAPGTQVMPVGVTATVWGEYRNQLSVKCQDIKAVNKQQG